MNKTAIASALALVLATPLAGAAESDSQIFEQTLRAARDGKSIQMLEVGEMYLTGMGTAKDIDKGLYWYQYAAEIGYRQGAYQLGQIYERGEWIPRDRALAVRWYRQAAEQGHEKANEAMVRLTGESVKPKPKVRKSAPAKPPVKTAAKAKYRSYKSTLATIEKNQWKKRGRPALYLPSTHTYCNAESGSLSCTSKEVNGVKGNKRYVYRVKSSLSSFTPDGYFEVAVSFRLVNIEQDKSVEFSDADDVPVVSNRQIARELQAKQEQLGCELSKADGTVYCLTGDGRKLEYTAK